VRRESSAAFAPGRVNLIGEHTDYNQGLALPFAIAQGITVCAEATHPSTPTAGRIHAVALDLGEEDDFALTDPSRASGWRAFVRGIVAELRGAGVSLPGVHLTIGGDLPQGAGLSSSAALEVALCLALLELTGEVELRRERIEIARLCARVENDWAGAQTGMLDQLASLYGASDSALCIDFQTLRVDLVPLRLEGWRFALLDSGESHANASSGYNKRRAECARACQLMGVDSLREAHLDQLPQLPEPLRRRALHVLEENRRVRATVAALDAGDLNAVGDQLTASHRSLREDYEVSTPAVETTVETMLQAGAAGARLMGGGFGGSVLGLFEADVPLPAGAREVHPGPGAHLLELEIMR
jgi:galactokinase